MNAAEAREAHQLIGEMVARVGSWAMSTEQEFCCGPEESKELYAEADEVEAWARALVADDREARELLAWAMKELRPMNEGSFIAAALSGGETEYTRNWQRARALLADPA
jgi:hypothetical protein